jgi:hypothetical protein
MSIYDIESLVTKVWLLCKRQVRKKNHVRNHVLTGTTSVQKYKRFGRLTLE